MSVIISLKNKDKMILASNNSYSSDYIKYPITFNKEYRIQKFKNFVIAYTGNYKDFVRLVDTFDFDLFPTPLTKSFLLREFYPLFLSFLVDNKIVELKDGLIEKTPFAIMIFDGKKLFDICAESVYEVKYCNATGDEMAVFTTYDIYKDKLEPLELLEKMLKETDRYYPKSSYPFIYCENLDEITIIEKDGSKRKEKLIEHWRKG